MPPDNPPVRGCLVGLALAALVGWPAVLLLAALVAALLF